MMHSRPAGFLWIVLPIVFLAGGCYTGARVVTTDQGNQIQRIAVVPMDSPPLALDPRFSAKLSTLPRDSTNLILAPEPVGTGGRVLASVFGLLVLASLPQAMQDAAVKADSVERLLASDARWHPSIALAEYVVTQLRSSATRMVIMVDTPHAFPGLERVERTMMIPNPVRDWYNADTSRIDYSNFAAQGVDGVLEVAVASYGVTDHSTIVGQIFIKLSDPRTKAILARTMQYDLSCGKKMSHPFENGAQELKANITACLAALGDKALKGIGLLGGP